MTPSVRDRVPRRRPGAPLLLAAPAVLAVALVLLPLAYLALRAGSGGAGAWEVLVRRGTGRLVVNTALLVVAVVGLSVALGVPLAWLTTRTDLPGARLWATAAALPLVIPSYVSALALLGALGPRGMLQGALEGPFGVERLPDIYGFGGAVLALTLSTYPFVLLLCAAALRTLDPALEEAARGLGSSRLATFRRVTLPELRPAIGAGGLLVALYAISDFGAVSLMQYDALTRAVFLQYRALFDRTPAAVLGLVLVALTLVVLALEARARRGREGQPSPRASRRMPVAVPLGRWRWPALAFCGTVVGLFLVMPVGVLVLWSARGARRQGGLELELGAAANSLLAAGLTALVAVVAVLPVALLAHRHPAGWTRLLERLSYAGNALPGIVIALSIVFFAANYAGALYQTLALLVFAYVVRFFPQALAGVGSALRAVSPRVEEAARGLGRRPLGVLVSVTAPLIRPGLLAGAALVFLSAMKELPATLLLRPIGFDTLATEIWQSTASASYSRAAPPALLLIALSAPLLHLLDRRGVEGSAPG